MRRAFREFMGGIRCAEIGVKNAVNAMNMLQGLPYAKFYLVDSYDVNNSTFQDHGEVPSAEQRANVIAEVRKKLLEVGSRVKLMVMDSAQAANKFPDGYLDFVYLDAQHEKACVLRDIQMWFPKVREGGVIAGHDISASGVRQAVTEFFDFCEFFEDGEDWWVFK